MNNIHRKVRKQTINLILNECDSTLLVALVALPTGAQIASDLTFCAIFAFVMIRLQYSLIDCLPVLHRFLAFHSTYLNLPNLVTMHNIFCHMLD